MKSRWPAGPIAAIAGVIVGLSLLDRFLATTETMELKSAARHSYGIGLSLSRQGKMAEALENIRNAHALDRSNPEYELQLIEVLTALGRTPEARAPTDEMLAREPNDGQTNLLAGRLADKTGDFPGAKAFYHRAIFGEWPQDAAAHRIQARLELIRMLVREHKTAELLPELISLEDEGPEDAGTQRQLAAWFMTAGAPARAADVFRALTARFPGETSASAGLGEAELELGDYRRARAAFEEAARRVSDPVVEDRLRLVRELTALDPTPRRLTSSEKYSRSVRILGLVRSDLEREMADRPGQQSSGALADLMRQAADLLGARTPAHVTNEAAEKILTLAQQIWKQRLAVFGTGSDTRNDVVRLIMEKVAA